MGQTLRPYQLRADPLKLVIPDLIRNLETLLLVSQTQAYDQKQILIFIRMTNIGVGVIPVKDVII